MRKTIHRALSGAPGLLLAFGALWATAHPERAAARFDDANALMSDGSSYVLAMAAVASYAILWWFTSLTPRTRFDTISEKGLRPIFNWLHRWASAFEIAESKESATEMFEEFAKQNLLAKEWLDKHAGPVARSKYISGRPDLVNYVVPGNSESERQRIIRTALAHIDILAKNVDDMMQSDKWVEPTKSKWKVWEIVPRFDPDGYLPTH